MMDAHKIDLSKTFYYWEPGTIYTPSVFAEKYMRCSLNEANQFIITKVHNETHYYSPAFLRQSSIKDTNLDIMKERVDAFMRDRGYILLDKETSDKYRLLL